MERLLVGQHILQRHGEPALRQRCLVRLDGAAGDRQTESLGAGHREEATAKIGERATLCQAMRQRRMHYRGQQSATWRKNAVTLPRGTTDRAQWQLVEKHRCQNLIEAAIRKRQGFLYVEREIFGALDEERGARDIDERLRLVADDEPGGRLAGVAPQHEWRKVAVARAQFENRHALDMPNLVEQQIVQHVALERAAMIARDAMPLLGNTVVICCARYCCLSFVMG